VPAIEVENLSKVFRISQKDPGVAGAVKALFRPRYQEKVAVVWMYRTAVEGEDELAAWINEPGK